MNETALPIKAEPPDVLKDTVKTDICVEGAFNKNVNVDPPSLEESDVKPLVVADKVGVPKSEARPVVKPPPSFTVTVHDIPSFT